MTILNSEFTPSNEPLRIQLGVLAVSSRTCQVVDHSGAPADAHKIASNMAHCYCRRKKMKVGAMDVTPYKFIWCGDIYGPKPYQFIGSRWAFIPQTLVVLPVPVPGFWDEFLGRL